MELYYRDLPRENYNDSRRGESVFQTTILATVTVACLVPLISIILGCLSVEQNESKMSYYALCCLMTIVVLMGLVSLLAIMFRVKFEPVPTSVFTDKEHSFYMLNLKVKCLWLFGIGVVLETGFDLTVNIHCIAVDPDVLLYCVYIFSDALKILYFCSHVYFVNIFKSIRLEDSRLVHYGIATIFLTNLSLCAWSIVDNSDILFDVANDITNKSGTLDIQSYNISVGACFWTSEVIEFLNKFRHYLTPLKMEFFLLATSIIMAFWPSTSTISSHLENGINPVLGENRRGILPPGRGILPPGTPEDHYWRQRETPEVPEDSTHNSDSSLSRSLTKFLIFNVAAISNLALYISAILQLFILKIGILALLYMKMMYKFALLIITIFGIHKLRQNCKKLHSVYLETSEHILIFALFGTVTANCLTALVCYRSQTLEGHLIAADTGLDILCVFYQTIFILESATYTTETKSSHFPLRIIFLLLSVSNITFWLGDSTYLSNDYQSDKLAPEVVGRKTWVICKLFLFPIALYYRFNSYTEFYGLYKKFSRAVPKYD